ncbi:DUF2169 family type VI secretion system accessory protein [Saccharospirillum salsuginis]|uniref:DUF2169 domain-containing protein n=1 Tax=Saccharospirillum salsuginis TaxID=418750 RepID=A0A918NA49_9GAMM|nr:DUF2169 domain-containing protein [Saccharospirillum salsuginis]GGX52575.1 hypothetical protein GCM10007392_19930 [Saccharospirillum salsuginis]
MILIKPRPHPYYQASITPGWTADGQSAHVLVVKASYQSDQNGCVTPLEQSAPLCEQDQYPDDDAVGRALELASDLAPFKAGSEILLYAHAWCASPRPSVKVSAELRMDNGIQWDKSLAVIGRRVWKNTLFGATPTEPEQLSDLPIRFEYAYGGHHPDDPDDACPTNPVGVGYLGRAGRRVASKGMPLPQVENPKRLMTRPNQRREPQGFGPLPSHWQPRQKAFSGMNDEKAARGDYPYDGPLPETAYHSAPGDQWFDRPLEGDGTLTLTGLTKGLPEHQPLKIDLRIPRLAVAVRDESEQSLSLAADTLIVETESQQFHVLYRHAFHGLPERYIAEVELDDDSPTRRQESPDA